MGFSHPQDPKMVAHSQQISDCGLFSHVHFQFELCILAGSSPFQERSGIAWRQAQYAFLRGTSNPNLNLFIAR